MKYLFLPIHLLKFWYFESLVVFLRTWKNLILFLEEDLAVTLMWRLIIVPLFHDTTIVGRILSFTFRIIRILIGLFAFGLASVLILLASLAWFGLPGLVFMEVGGGWSWWILAAGVGFFIIHAVTHPHKATWEVHDPKDLWVASLLNKKQVTVQKLLNNFEVQNFIGLIELSPAQFENYQVSDIEQVGKDALLLSKKTISKYIGPSHFFVSIIKNSPGADNILLTLNLSIEDFENALIYQGKKKNYWRKVWLWDGDFEIRHLKGINRGWLGVPTPQLDKYSLDLTKIAGREKFHEFVGRKELINEVINILSQEGKRNVAIVGPAGSGKTALIHYLAKIIIRGDAPSSLATKRIILLDSTRLLAGISAQGELADRIKQIFDEIAFAGNVILVIEEIHNLGIGEVGASMNLYALIAPFLESNQFQFIATSESLNYSRILEKNANFARLFTKVEVPAVSESESIEILENLAIEMERNKKIRVSYIAIKRAVELALDLIHDRVLPDSAIEILEQAEVEAQNNLINKQLIEDLVQKRVKVPIVSLGKPSKDRLLNLEKEIHQGLIDQEEAVRTIADSLRRSATGLKEKKRPIGSFLFVGPTGVGKTELAKILAEVYFKDAFIRFDMSEYQTSDSVNRLIGVSGEGGILTEAVRAKQYALVLVDEFEKANPNILNLFLQVLDDGRLTDGAGRTIDFTNTIIIATSNAASLIIAQGLEAGQSLESLESQVKDELLKEFRPELINRFDGVILFKSLSQEDLQKIVRLKLADLQNQMKEQGYLIEFDDGLIRQLAERGFDLVLGARPLRRLIQDTLEAKLSKMVLQNQLQKGTSFKVGMELLV